MLNTAVQFAAESAGHHEINVALSIAIGLGTLAILLAMLAALMFFGAGREHS